MSNSSEVLEKWFEATLRTINQQCGALLDGIAMWERGIPWPDVVTVVRANLERIG
jgi:hypothetical protein